MLDFINKPCFTILNNNNSPPTFLSTIGSVWIDIGDFRVRDKLTMSDHNLITFYISNIWTYSSKIMSLNMNSINKWNFVVDIKQMIYAVKAKLDNASLDKFIKDVVGNIKNIYKKNKIKVKKKCKDAW